jgi:hypothetical protein
MMKLMPVAFSAFCLMLAACGGEPVAGIDVIVVIDVVDAAEVGDAADAVEVVDVVDVVEVIEVPTSFTIMTFNTGTTDNLDHGGDPDGYTNAFAAISAEYFGNNLSWLPGRAGLRFVIDTLKPDVVAFQELFYDPECVDICAELQMVNPEIKPAVCDAGGNFVCAVWAEGAELTVRAAVGPDYAIACAPDHNDNCIAVRKDFGTLADCVDGPCIGGLDGMKPKNGCNSGARVATGLVTVTGGPEIAVVDVHTVVGPDNLDCRVAQLKQVFEDRGDGKPAAFGTHNIVLGDMNIDPFLMSDASIKYWNSMVGDDKPFHYLSSADQSGPDTHPFSFMKLDHVISDNLTGSCVVLGVSPDTAAPVSAGSTYFDHRPVFCTVDMPAN